MADFKAIETQEQLEEVLKERLKKERETIRKEYEGYLSPQQVDDKYKGYLSPDAVTEKYKEYLSPEDAAKLNTKIKGYETDSVKTRIAHETGLSYDAVQFLRGEDEESIRKSAESLKGLMGVTDVPPLANTEAQMPSVTEVALKNTLKGLKGE